MSKVNSKNSDYLKFKSLYSPTWGFLTKNKRSGTTVAKLQKTKEEEKEIKPKSAPRNVGSNNKIFSLTDDYGTIINPDNMKEVLILQYKEIAKCYPPLEGHFSLALIDRKKKIVTNRDTDDQEMVRYVGKPWHKCRETFSNVFQDKCKSIVYCSAQGHTPVLKDFLKQVENTIKIPKDRHSIVIETNVNNISAIRVSPFWLASNARRQMLTLFVRAASYYQSGYDIMDAMKDYPLVSNASCLQMIELFLEGYTRFDSSIQDMWKGDFHKGLIYYFGKHAHALEKNQIIEKELMMKE